MREPIQVDYTVFAYAKPKKKKNKKARYGANGHEGHVNFSTAQTAESFFLDSENDMVDSDEKPVEAQNVVSNESDTHHIEHIIEDCRGQAIERKTRVKSFKNGNENSGRGDTKAVRSNHAKVFAESMFVTACIVVVICIVVYLYKGDKTVFLSNKATTDHSYDGCYYALSVGRFADSVTAGSVADSYRQRGGAGLVLKRTEYEVLICIYDTKAAADNVRTKLAAEGLSSDIIEVFVPSLDYGIFPARTRDAYRACLQYYDVMYTQLYAMSQRYSLREISELELAVALKALRQRISTMANALDSAVELEDKDMNYIKVSSELIGMLALLDNLINSDDVFCYRLAALRYSAIYVINSYVALVSSLG